MHRRRAPQRPRVRPGPARPPAALLALPLPPWPPRAALAAPLVGPEVNPLRAAGEARGRLPGPRGLRGPEAGAPRGRDRAAPWASCPSFVSSPPAWLWAEDRMPRVPPAWPPAGRRLASAPPRLRAALPALPEVPAPLLRPGDPPQHRRARSRRGPRRGRRPPSRASSPVGLQRGGRVPPSGSGGAEHGPSQPRGRSPAPRRGHLPLPQGGRGGRTRSSRGRGLLWARTPRCRCAGTGG